VVSVGGFDKDHGFRFHVDDQIVDVLAPDGLSARNPARTGSNMKTIQIPGGSQALKRTELVELRVAGEKPVLLRRPTLIGAILLKARALPVHSQPEDQRHDLVSLLALLDDPGAAREELSGTERGWLRRIETGLALDDPALTESFDEARLRFARAAYQRLID
jgi:hypothetical protein